MAIRAEMTWEAPKSRWRKMHHGKIYTVSCDLLGTPPTKEASYLAANAWWQSKRAEIDGQTPPHFHHQTITEIRRRIDWAKAARAA